MFECLENVFSQVQNENFETFETKIETLQKQRNINIIFFQLYIPFYFFAQPLVKNWKPLPYMYHCFSQH